MTPTQISILNNLLLVIPKNFTRDERLYLVRLSRFGRPVLISRIMSIALAELGIRRLDADPLTDPGIPDPPKFLGKDITPVPETGEFGGPNGLFPAGLGDILDPIPDQQGPVAVFDLS